jgi:hypothetical protein
MAPMSGALRKESIPYSNENNNNNNKYYYL